MIKNHIQAVCTCVPARVFFIFILGGLKSTVTSPPMMSAPEHRAKCFRERRRRCRRCRGAPEPMSPADHRRRADTPSSQAQRCRRLRWRPSTPGQLSALEDEGLDAGFQLREPPVTERERVCLCGPSRSLVFQSARARSQQVRRPRLPPSSMRPTAWHTHSSMSSSMPPTPCTWCSSKSCSTRFTIPRPSGAQTFPGQHPARAPPPQTRPGGKIVPNNGTYGSCLALSVRVSPHARRRVGPRCVRRSTTQLRCPRHSPSGVAEYWPPPRLQMSRGECARWHQTVRRNRPGRPLSRPRARTRCGRCTSAGSGTCRPAPASTSARGQTSPNAVSNQTPNTRTHTHTHTHTQPDQHQHQHQHQHQRVIALARAPAVHQGLKGSAWWVTGRARRVRGHELLRGPQRLVPACASGGGVQRNMARWRPTQTVVVWGEVDRHAREHR